MWEIRMSLGWEEGNEEADILHYCHLKYVSELCNQLIIAMNIQLTTSTKKTTADLNQ